VSVSIDGIIHKGTINVKYGESFPIAKRSMELNNNKYGNVLVYVIELGTPEWTNKMSVNVPFRFYITDIISPSREYLETKRRNKLKIIK